MNPLREYADEMLDAVLSDVPRAEINSPQKLIRYVEGLRTDDAWFVSESRDEIDELLVAAWHEACDARAGGAESNLEDQAESRRYHGG